MTAARPRPRFEARRASGPAPSPVLERLRGGLVVSCQALAGMPFDAPAWIAELVRAAELGGAAGVRVDRPENVVAARRATQLPIVAVHKLRRPDRPVYITPTLAAALTLVDSGADIVAMDATRRPPWPEEALSLAERVTRLHARGAAVLGDVADEDDALYARDAGVDAVATTLNGIDGPRVDGVRLVARLARRLDVPVLLEGGVTTPDEARRALDAGAFAVVVGRAITMPDVITRRFVERMRTRGPGP